jgi:glucose/arabinose dehydrogenase
VGRFALPVVVAAVLAAGCASGQDEAVPTTAVEPPAPTTGTTSGTTTPSKFGLQHLRLEVLASGLDSPVGLSATPAEPDWLYVVEQPGTVRVLENGAVADEPFLDITSEVRSGGEQGLLSLAFHPEYAANGLFYVDYTDTNGDTRVVEFQARAGSAPIRKRELLFVDQPYANHNGGQLAFGPDGRLYVGMGDGGSGGDPENRAQDLSQRLGKLLSIDVDEPGAAWRIEGYGLRNPWRFSFDRETGDLWIGDVGQGEWEEIDHTPRESPGLENYGWDAFEGTHVYEEKDPNPAGHLVMPVYAYSHDEGCSVTGGYVYRGDDISAARGRYFFADYCSDRMWSLVLGRGHARDVRRDAIPVSSVSSFGEDAHGELYVLSLEGDVVKLVPG